VDLREVRSTARNKDHTGRNLAVVRIRLAHRNPEEAHNLEAQDRIPEEARSLEAAHNPEEARSLEAARNPEEARNQVVVCIRAEVMLSMPEVVEAVEATLLEVQRLLSQEGEAAEVAFGQTRSNSARMWTQGSRT
jgi:hypothetical protein